MANQLSGLTGQGKDWIMGKMDDVGQSFDDWLDQSPEGTTGRKVRVFMLGAGAVLLGATFIASGLALMHVIGPAGFQPNNLVLSMKALPMLGLGLGLAAGGVGAGLGLAARAVPKKHQKTVEKVATVVAVVGLFAAAGLLNGYLFGTGIKGLVAQPLLCLAAVSGTIYAAHYGGAALYHKLGRPKQRTLTKNRLAPYNFTSKPRPHVY